MKSLKDIAKKVWTLQGAISLWAGIATILAFFLAIIDVTTDRQVEIKNPEDLSTAIISALHYVEQKKIKPDANLVQQVSRLDAVVRREFGVIKSGSKPFVLGEGDGVFLYTGKGNKVPFGVSTIHTQHKYLYVGVNEKRRQLYVGQSAVFDVGDSECKVTLMAIDDGRKEGSFNFQC